MATSDGPRQYNEGLNDGIAGRPTKRLSDQYNAGYTQGTSMRIGSGDGVVRLHNPLDTTDTGIAGTMTQNNTPRINTTKWKPCPNGHPFPEEYTSDGKTVIMCRVPECGWCAPSYTWNLRHKG